MSFDETIKTLGQLVFEDKSVDDQNVLSVFIVPPDCAQLAEALERDPRRICHFARNNFEYVLYYAALKGPCLTLHERIGNDFDQASLLIEILCAAGFTAHYRYGIATVSTTDLTEPQHLANWLGIEADPELIVRTFSNGGVPLSVCGNKILGPLVSCVASNQIC